MRRVLLSETAYKNLGTLTLVAGICVVLVIYPLLDFVDEDRRVTMAHDNERSSSITNNDWTQERENGYLLLAVAMTVGQLMVFIGLIMMVMGAMKAYMHWHLAPKAIQCENCQTWFTDEYASFKEILEDEGFPRLLELLDKVNPGSGQRSKSKNNDVIVI